MGTLLYRKKADSIDMFCIFRKFKNAERRMTWIDLDTHPCTPLPFHFHFLTSWRWLQLEHPTLQSIKGNTFTKTNKAASIIVTGEKGGLMIFLHFVKSNDSYSHFTNNRLNAVPPLGPIFNSGSRSVCGCVLVVVVGEWVGGWVEGGGGGGLVL